MAISNDTGLSWRPACFHPSPEIFTSLEELVGIFEGGDGSFRPVLTTVSPVVDPVSVGVVILTFGNVGGNGMGLLRDGDSRCWLRLIPPKLLFRSVRLLVWNAPPSGSMLGVDPPFFRVRLGPLSLLGVSGLLWVSVECGAESEEVVDVVKSSRSRAKFSIPLDRDLRLVSLLEEGRAEGRR